MGTFVSNSAQVDRRLIIPHRVDIRKFGTKATGGMTPANDPYYGRKPVDSAQTKGVGELDQTPAEAYAVRERKQSVVNFSNDPFQVRRS
jgi:hypothetical protein